METRSVFLPLNPRINIRGVCSENAITLNAMIKMPLEKTLEIIALEKQPRCTLIKNAVLKKLPCIKTLLILQDF